MITIREIAKLVSYGTKSIKTYRDLKAEKNNSTYTGHVDITK